VSAAVPSVRLSRRAEKIPAPGDFYLLLVSWFFGGHAGVDAGLLAGSGTAGCQCFSAGSLDLCFLGFGRSAGGMLAVFWPFPYAISRPAIRRRWCSGWSAPPISVMPCRPLTLALAMVFFALQTAFFLYQTVVLLIIAWTIATLVLAMGPIRSAILQARPNLEEASWSLGYGPIATFFHVLLPRLRRGIIAGIVLVFLFCMKELPITLLLSPTGFNTLAVSVFTRTVEGMMAEAAPFAAAIVLFSGISVGMILRREKAL
jgi:ABC-type Fe3+ transport system permease subunit